MLLPRLEPLASPRTFDGPPELRAVCQALGRLRHDHRQLLGASSLGIEGAAITSVKIKGAEHEFSSIKGATEDVTDIILNVRIVVA